MYICANFFLTHRFISNQIDTGKENIPEKLNKIKATKPGSRDL